MSDYSLDNAWDRARRRLDLLEGRLDPVSRRRLAALGVQEGWRCLEVAGGGGSLTRWLCDRIGSDGHVLATDIDPRFLEEIEAPNLEVLRHDVMADELPAGNFDLVHVRWLLHHLPYPERAVARMAAALRPGGWLLIEDVDFFPVHASPKPLYTTFMIALTDTVLSASGGDGFRARVLPPLLEDRGLVDVDADCEVAVFRGGSPWAEFFQLSAEQVRDRITGASGTMSPEQLEEALALLDDPTFWAFAGAELAVWGKRPLDST